MPFNYPDLVRAWAEELPDGLALSDLTTDLTWAQVDERSDRVAAGLQALGVAADERVVYIGKNSLAFYELLYGLAKIGAVAAPLNLRLTADEIHQLADDTGARLAVVDADLEHLLGGRLQVIHTGPEFDEWREAQPREHVAGPTHPDVTVVQSYTSGTTGLPKGVLITNRMYEVTCRIQDELYPPGPGNVWGVFAPVHHVGGTTPAVYSVHSGGAMVLMPAFDADGVLDVIESRRVTFAGLAPVTFSMLADAQKARPRDISSFTSAMYGGQSITSKAVEHIFGILPMEIFQSYGMTEVAGGPITRLNREDHFGPRRLSAGVPTGPYDVAAFGPDDERLGVGEVGEIRLLSEQTTPGYWGRPEATAELYVDGWLRTGDAGYIDEDGYLFLIDRIKDMIVTGAENVYPAEVERVLIDHPAIAEVAVVGAPHEKWGETVAAFVVLAPGTTLTEDELIEWCRPRMAGFRRPRQLHVIDELPKNLSGKILRRELKAGLWGGPDARQIG
jgi:acyl-CoA synthetase (AMP-forming)/AMP-acid ligase II